MQVTKQDKYEHYEMSGRSENFPTEMDMTHDHRLSMTPVSLAKTTESYEVSLATINR